MCIGGRLLADFVAGTSARPVDLPELVARCLTTTVDGTWVVWAHKVALIDGDEFRALTGVRYPADARARCSRGTSHDAPQRDCTCGFHAVSKSLALTQFAPSHVGGPASLCVVLTGRVLAFEWTGPDVRSDEQVLFRAERQTVVHINKTPPPERRPDDPSALAVSVLPHLPFDQGPVRLTLPSTPPTRVIVDDDAGYCIGARPTARVRANRQLVHA